MDNPKRIITIGRQVGSGGRLVAKAIADKLGLPFFDREILLNAAKESGIKGDFFEKTDERNNFFSRIASYFAITQISHVDNCLSSESLFKFQSDAMRKAAQESGGVFVGRCSDYVLRDFERKTDVFITANIGERVRRASEYFGLAEAETEKRINEMEAARRDYYNFFTNKTWGAAESYHLCLDSTGMEIDSCAELIISYITASGR